MAFESQNKKRRFLGKCISWGIFVIGFFSVVFGLAEISSPTHFSLTLPLLLIGFGCFLLSSAGAWIFWFMRQFHVGDFLVDKHNKIYRVFREEYLSWIWEFRGLKRIKCKPSFSLEHTVYSGNKKIRNIVICATFTLEFSDMQGFVNFTKLWEKGVLPDWKKELFKTFLDLDEFLGKNSSKAFLFADNMFFNSDDGGQQRLFDAAMRSFFEKNFIQKDLAGISISKPITFKLA